MKFRLILVTLLMLPFSLCLKGQDKIIFYSKAPMYVKYKDTESTATKGEQTSTTLYIAGSARFNNGAAIKQQGRTDITGDFINSKDPSSADSGSRNLFIDKSPADNEKTGVIAFIGKGSSNRATLQRIYGDLPSGGSITEQKIKSWINFPTITIEKGLPTHASDDWRNVGYLMVDTTASISVDYVRAKRGERFAVNASYNSADPRIINSGYARILNTASDTDSPTYSQVNLKLYEYTQGVSDDGAMDAQGKPTAVNNTLRTSDGWNYLTGFTPPFSEMGADYLFYHALTKPNNVSMTSNQGPILDPFRRLKSGAGYFTSMEVSSFDHDIIDERWDFENDLAGANTGIRKGNRARGGYVFNRMTFHDHLAKPNGVMDNFSRFYYDATSHTAIHGASRPIAGLNDPQFFEVDIMDGVEKDRSRYEQMLNEKFNTAQNEVVVSLTAGLNFLGNPFMVPISLNPLLGYNADGSSMGFLNTDFENGVDMPAFTPSGNTNVKVSSKSVAGADIRSKYWLINEALIKYDDNGDLFHYKTKYDYISRDAGATIASATGDATHLNGITPLEYNIAPMQMFCLQANKDVDIKLDMNALSNFGQTHFLKSQTAETNDILKDWFVVEAVNEKDKTADRASVIFREKALSKYNQDPYDTRKGLSEDMENFVPEYKGKKTRTKLDAATSIIYTKSSDGEKLLGNALPTTTKEVALFFTPPTETQEVTLRFLGLENVEAVSGVWLVDKKLDNKTIKVTPETEYSFIAEADATSNENRFILRFYEKTNEIIDNNEVEPITCYYASSTLHVKGLNEEDLNSDIQIYDMQGRMIGKTKVNNTPSQEFVKPLSVGTYILKITGKRNYTTKFANLKN